MTSALIAAVAALMYGHWARTGMVIVRSTDEITPRTVRVSRWYWTFCAIACAALSGVSLGGAL